MEMITLALLLGVKVNQKINSCREKSEKTREGICRESGLNPRQSN